MAEKYTPEEIQEIFERYDDAVKTTGQASASLKKEFADAQTGLKNYSAELSQSLKKLGTGVQDYTKAMYKGQQGLTAMNGAVDSAAGAIEALLLIIPGSALLKAGLYVASKAVGVFADGIKAINKQGDELYKAFQDLSRAGSIGAGGVTQVFNSMQKFGYNIDELGKMTELLKANSETLAQFGNTAISGAEKFAATADTIQNSGLRQTFFNLGMGVDDINKGIAGYITHQTRLGMIQNRTQAQLTEGASAYIFELEALTRLTGKDKQKLQDEQAEARRSNPYFAKLREAERQDKLDNGGRAKDLRTALALFSQTPAGKKAFLDSVSGFVSTDKEAQAFNRGVGGVLPSAIASAAAGKGTYVDAYIAAQKGAASRQPANDQAALIPNSALNIGVLEDLTITANRDVASAVAEIQANMGKKVDPVTASMSKLKDEQIQTTRNLQDFVQLGVSPATTALSKLASVANSASGALPGENKPNSKPTYYGADSPRTKAAQGKAYDNQSFKENAPKLMENLMKDFSLTKAQAAGVVGNLAHESAGLQPDINEKNPLIKGSRGGYGLAQWTGPRRIALENFAKSNNLPLDSVDTQYAFLKQELTTNQQYAAILERVKQQKTAADAAKAFLPFESPAVTAMGSRVANAEAAEKLSGGTAAVPVVTETVKPKAAPVVMEAGKPGFDFKTASAAEMAKANKGYQFGGVASGPLNGYQATLHGSEAIVPLADGKSIPVEMPGHLTNMQDQTGLMTAQLSKLDELIGAMNKQNSIAGKILQRSS